jgi:hypothetical protein
MKTHIRNLLVVSAIYGASLIIAIIIALGMDIGLFYDGFDPDTAMFVLSIIFVTLVSWAAYFVFYLIQRHVANNDIHAQFMGVGPRIIGGLVASLISAGAILFACFALVSEEGSEESILYMNVPLVGIIIGLFTVINFVNFIMFKPRQ